MSSLMMTHTETSPFSDSFARAIRAGAGSVEANDPMLAPLLQAVLQQLNATTGQPQSQQPTPAAGRPKISIGNKSGSYPAPINTFGVRPPPPISVGTPPAGYSAEVPSFFSTPEPTPTHSSRSHTPPHTESDASAEEFEQLCAQSRNAQMAVAAAAQLDPCTPLRHCWVYWASWKLETEQLGTMEDCRPIGECGTMGGFWDGFSRLLVADMPVNVSLQLLRQGVPPMYDHPENRNGGHFKIRAASLAAACTLWSQLTVAIAREQLPCADQVQGCNVVKKLRSTTLQVWVVNSLSKATVEAVRQYLLAHLPRGDYLRLKFCPHKYLLRTLQTKRAQRRGAYDDDF